jgi:protein tyrosine/serine phosphatase
MMHIFQNTLNTRPIIENSFKYIRSDVPTKITEDEKDWLLSNNITTIVDLRTEEERVRKHCPLIDDNRFFYHVFPIAGGDQVPPSTDNVSKSYIAMVDSQFDTMIEFLLNTKSNVLYFCNAGKDRTGVVSAVLLYKLGMSPEYIVNDYMKSKFNLETLLKGFARQNQAINIDVITPHKRYIEEFLKWYINEKADCQ